MSGPNPNVIRKGAGWWCVVHRVYTGVIGWCSFCDQDAEGGR